ncbi:hypothetical protein ABW19_dt0208588 [Dactylella cylindrospora]|nr:hypothetical protein ABW19_dt0208588 [Dactylella cylindrospora]
MENLMFRSYDEKPKKRNSTANTLSTGESSKSSAHKTSTDSGQASTPASESTAESTMPQELEVGQLPSYSDAPPPVELPGPPPAFVAPGVSNLYPNVFPTPDHCIVHLKLLHAFSAMRDHIENTQGIFFATVPGVGDPITDELRLKDKRWSIFVSRAVYRFNKWWNTIPAQKKGSSWHRLMLGYSFNNDMENSTLNGRYMPFDPTNLPPLDVLMVWHAYTLNPRNFFEDCLRHGKLDFWYTGLPWAAINECIDPYTFEYRLPDSAIYKWEAKAQVPFNNLDTPNYRGMCASCGIPFEPPWNAPDDTGFADRTFMLVCPRTTCGKVHTMDTLSKDKFIKEMNELVQSNYPMPGSILDLNGLPKSLADHEKAWENVQFPNRLIKELVYSLRNLPQNAGVQDVRKQIEAGIGNKYVVQKAATTTVNTRGNFLNVHKVTVRRMMAAYWDNPWPQSINLVGAVLRQGTFVAKMVQNMDWYHSPSIRSTMERCCLRYNRFLSLMRSRPKKTLVPTLDIDLAWHTHQTMAHNYHKFSVTTTNRFVDHDDKIDESKLSTAFEYTTKEYQKVYKEPYSECGCWYCQVVRETAVGGVRRMFNQKPLEYDCGTDEPMNHLSSHGVVRVEDKAMEAQRKLLKLKLDTAYKRLCQEREKKGKKPPRRPAEWEYYYGPYYPFAYYPYGLLELMAIVSMELAVPKWLVEAVEGAAVDPVVALMQLVEAPEGAVEAVEGAVGVEEVVVVVETEEAVGVAVEAAEVVVVEFGYEFHGLLRLMLYDPST